MVKFQEIFLQNILVLNQALIKNIAMCVPYSPDICSAPVTMGGFRVMYY